MLKVIRLCLEQQMPNYRKPASFLVRESYPLPPYSSVIGMIHTACSFTSYHPMDISIQGSYGSEVSDYATMYNMGAKYNPNDNPPRHQAKVTDEDGKEHGINIGPKPCHLLTDVELVIHIKPTNDDDFDVILNGLLNPVQYLSLGRHEDIVNITEVKVAELTGEDDEEDDFSTKYSIYIPADNFIRDVSSYQGTIYKLTKVFDTKKSDKRIWEQVVRAKHIGADVNLDEYEISDLYRDNEIGSVVCFA